MIPFYTPRDLGMNISGTKYFLPFEDVTEETVMEKTVQMFSTLDDGEASQYMCLSKQSAVTHEKNHITVHCLYRGYDEYYPFSIAVNVFRLKHENPAHHGAYLIAMYMEHCYQGLLDELLDEKVTPQIVTDLKLKAYSYFNL
jgi:hypothetical protein